jgi:hypothetical protein
LQTAFDQNFILYDDYQLFKWDNTVCPFILSLPKPDFFHHLSRKYVF